MTKEGNGTGPDLIVLGLDEKESRRLPGFQQANQTWPPRPPRR